jgi:hypothetical protein
VNRALDPPIAYEQQHLLADVDLNASRVRPGGRPPRANQRAADLRPDDPVARMIPPALQGDHRMPRLHAKHPSIAPFGR